MMLHLPSTIRYYLYRSPANMRKGLDSLSGIVTSQMNQQVLDGSIFIFLNRNRTHIKLLLWEGDGFSLYYNPHYPWKQLQPKHQPSTLCYM